MEQGCRWEAGQFIKKGDKTSRQLLKHGQASETPSSRSSSLAFKTWAKSTWLVKCLLDGCGGLDQNKDKAQLVVLKYNLLNCFWPCKYAPRLNIDNVIQQKQTKKTNNVFIDLWFNGFK